MVDLKIFTDNIEHEALDQINTLIEQPAFADSKIRIMPDVHAGKGCVIGFTADLGDKVIPNIVGVDIGCGMMTVKLGKIDIDFERLDLVIRERIPCGRNVHKERVDRYSDILNLRCYRDLRDTKRFERSLGTLGGGNHFIEIDVDSNDNKYLIIHTGSRNLGKQVAEYYQNLAIELMQGKDKLFEQQNTIIELYKAQGRKNEIQDAIKKLKADFKAKTLDIPKELCYLTGTYRDDYLNDMGICQHFAHANRMTIAARILNGMDWDFDTVFETIHNYIHHETNIVRKGAISAEYGKMLLIPINMRDGCILGIGKGNPDWNHSAPHGAGRLMSRHKARESINLDDYRKSMEGIFTTSVNESTIDESPMAYKSMDEIVRNIEDTVEIIDILKPIYNFKAGE